MPATSEPPTPTSDDFDLEDFFSEPEQPAAGPDAANSPMAGDSLAAGDGDDSDAAIDDRELGAAVDPQTTSDQTPMFAETAGDAWTVVGEGPSGVAPPDVIGSGADAVPVDPAKRPVWARIMDLEHELGEACREEERLRGLVKSAKELRIELTEQLEELCRERDNPPAASQDTAAADPLAGLKSTPSVTGSASTSPASPAGEAVWGREPIEVLGSHGLKPAKVEALRAAADAGKFGGDVVGLRDWIAKYDLWHRDVKGCGPKGADAVIDALTSYITANPMAEEPLTAEDEARHATAAEWLGHTKPSGPSGQLTNQELAEDVPCPTDNTAIVGGASEYVVPQDETAILPTAVEPTAEPCEPLVANVKPKTKRKLKTQTAEPVADKSPAATAPHGGYHEANADALKRVDAMLAGKPDPGPTKPAAAASPPQADEKEAYLKGCEAGASNASCSDNPFPDRSSPQAKEWQRGWEECSAVD